MSNYVEEEQAIASGIVLLIRFLAFAIPKIPGIANVAKDFWGENNLGPMPPDMSAWEDVDAQIDAQRAAQKGSGK